MKCQLCGNKVKKSEASCPNCGARVIPSYSPDSPLSFESASAFPPTAEASTEKHSLRCGKNFVIKQIRKAKGWRALQFGLPLVIIDTLILISIINSTATELQEVTWVNIAISLVPTLILLPLLIYNMVGLLHPLGNPIFKRLARYGSPQEICRLVDQEIDDIEIIGNNLISPHFFFLRSPGRFDAVLQQDIIWVYIEERYKFTHVFLFFFYLKVFHDVVVIDYNRKTHVFRFKSRKETEENVQAILNRLPYVLLNKEEDNKKLVREKAEEIHQYILYKRTHPEEENQEETDAEDTSVDTEQAAYE